MEFDQAVEGLCRGLGYAEIEHRIDGLPQNMILPDVTVQKDGFRADLSGQNVVLAED